jgi:L-asparaginase II
MRVVAEVERSGLVESRHYGIVVVADVGGRVLAAAGDPDEVVYLRSCAKPFQALAVWSLDVERTLGVDRLGLAGAAGSHAGEPVHVESARKVLAAAGLDERALRCPPALPRDPAARELAPGPAPIYHNCSGKHAYLLAGAVAQGWERERYTSPEHPVQAVVADTVADYAGVPIERVGVDGCGVPVHAIALRGLATAYARLAARAAGGAEGPAALVEALRQHPVMLAGTGSLDTVLLEVTGGRVLAKAGAEGVHAAADLASGRGLALKVLDGADRARRAALFAALRALGWLDERELEAIRPLVTSEVLGGGERVGEVRPAALDLELDGSE